MARLAEDGHPARRSTTDSNSAFTRTTFETSRLLEFFTESELQMQIGHAQALWPLALLKELIDNALDACESADVQPDLDVEITADRIRVRNNGPGLPLATLERSLDYAVRVSDKAFYVSPSRGQLGNALKCVYAAPFVVDGQQGRVDVATGGQRHAITIRLDRLSQKPVLEMISTRGHVKAGTEVVLHWKDVASSFHDTADDFYMAARGSIGDPRDLISRYAIFNPHLRLRYQDQRGRRTFIPTTPGWQKWQPNHPTSPHWYTPERLRGLLAAYLTADRAHGRSRTVREVVAEFAGLSGTAKQKLVTGAVRLTGARLDDLVVDGDLVMDRVTGLLRAMQQQSRPIKPAALGVIGAAHLRQRLIEDYGITAESFKYAKEAGTTATGVPWVVETALAFCDDDRPRQLLCGVNFSPLLDAETFHFVAGRLGAHRIDPHDPVVVVLHLANPRVRFSDRGKSVLALEDDEEVPA